MQSLPSDIRRPKLVLTVAIHLVFWTWTSFFALVSVFGALPLLLNAPRDSLQAFDVQAALILLLPGACLALGYRWRTQPTRMLQLFYGVQLPLLLLATARTFALDQWSRGAQHVFICTAFATAALFINTKHKALLHLQLAARTVGVLLAVWASLLALSLLPAPRPIPAQTLLVLIVMAPFLLYAGTLLIAPVALVWSHLVGYRRLVQFHKLRARHTELVIALTVVAFAASAVWANRQPSVEDDPLHAYLAPELYVSADFGNVLATPFVYRGESFADDQLRAKDIYLERYDTPIEKGERATIAKVKAHERLWAFNRESNVLDVDAKRVHLFKQEVTLLEQGDFASIELHDQYRNETESEQEIFYYFTLPEDAAITGLWLGATPNREERWQGVLAPRGAAQRVYRAEVSQRVDPALVEQLGPTQYRLRAFPVPRQGDLHVWMAYTAARQGSEWPRPNVIEKRNAYWDTDEWVAQPLAATRKGPAQETLALPDRTLVTRERIDAPLTQLPRQTRILLVIDESASMKTHDVTAQLDWARAHLAEHNEVNVAYKRGIVPLAQASGAKAEGYATLSTVLAQADRSHDVWFVLSDNSGSEGDAPADAPALWFISAQPAQQFTDATQKLLARRGSGVAASLDKAVLRYAAMADPSIVTVTDAHIWRRAKGRAHGADTFATAVAIKHVVSTAKDPKAAHALAASVTPFSSLIVLVDERQREALRNASGRDDAFVREAETGLPQANFSVTATPEPEEWALLILALVIVLLSVKQTKATRALS